MNFQDSLRLSIALGLTIFLVLLRFDSDRIESDGFRTFDPRAELERFIVDAHGLTGDARVAFAGGAFTGPMELRSFLDGVAGQLGEHRCAAAGPPAGGAHPPGLQLHPAR